MPAPYLTLSELVAEAHQLGTDLLAHIIDTADAHEWTPTHTYETLLAARRHQLHQLPGPIEVASSYARELDLTETVASYLTTLTSYEQTGDPAEADALEQLEQHLAQLVGLDELDDDDDRDQLASELDR